jgi:hypothetical protein
MGNLYNLMTILDQKRTAKRGKIYFKKGQNLEEIDIESFKDFANVDGCQVSYSGELESGTINGLG